MRVCVFVETFEIFIYICAGRQLSNNLIPHLPERQTLASIINKLPTDKKPLLKLNESNFYLYFKNESKILVFLPLY
ncbi:MAG: hypothetical protein FD170_432 [Bacteroidetes bacterium]|nr:MAG: hypothetical protein FD170_432 [Bacteroidota bacterium]